MPTNQISTDRQIAALKPRDKLYEVGIQSSRGLCLRVFPTGTKNFEFRYTANNGLRRRHPLGAYPDIGLSLARAKAAALRVSVVDGDDPAARRAEAREKARTGETLSELADAYWRAAARGLHGGRRRPKREVTIQKEKGFWKNHLERAMGSRRFAEIKRADVRIFMRDLALDSGLSPSSVAGVGSLLQSILGFAVHEERLEANPAVGLAQPLALTSRDRMFNDEGLAILQRAAKNASPLRFDGHNKADKHARLEPEMGLALQLLMLTLTRRSEAAGARWAEIDLNAGLWTIPSERAKARHLHVVPLSPSSLAVLLAARDLHPKSPFVFPSQQVKGAHLDPHAVTRAVARICKRHQIAAGSPHDIRRSGATTLVGRYGVSRLVVGFLLGHTAREGAAVTSVYDRHSYIPEKRAALVQWANHLSSLES
ncbi:site-specific integrase [Brevundimonas sp. PAMC22021]|uniref:tyrosine-type recombinase/integrase n=1 Tax=Brevundimonas sp. PAMC22021 TaxID=2861285 RepID=UPI001C634678|nr:site-specific integrase [Brevundimonas sp. PAMC22021]QYF87064.1 tyrosine-type recombinase/integrase [Brevundimonas sp. PAMC22021]